VCVYYVHIFFPDSRVGGGGDLLLAATTNNVPCERRKQVTRLIAL